MIRRWRLHRAILRHAARAGLSRAQSRSLADAYYFRWPA